MRKFFELLILFLKRNKSSLLISFGFPILMIAFSLLGGNTSNAAKVVLVNEDKGTLAKEILDDYEHIDDIKIIDTREEAEESIIKTDADVLYVIPDNFSESLEGKAAPTIERVTRESAELNSVGFEMHLEAKSKAYVDRLILEEHDLLEELPVQAFEVQQKNPRFSGKESLLVFFMSFSILYGSSLIGNDLISQKKEKVLRRGISTPTSGHTILASSLAGAWVIQFIAHLFALIIIQFIIPLSMTQILILLGIIFVMCFYSVCFQLLLLRLFKDPQISVTVGMMFCMFMAFLPMIFEMKEVLVNLPSWFFRISYASPVYWAMNISEYGSIPLGLSIVLLMGIVLFTAGSIRLKDFAE